MNSLSLNEYRCRCGKLLLKGLFFDGTLEIKCKKCGVINNIGNIERIEANSHYVLIINNGIISNANLSAYRILGYSREELIGKHFTFLNPTLPKEIGEKFFGPNSILTEENYFKLDTIHKTKSGKNLFIISNLKLFKPNDKERSVLLIAEVKKESENKKSRSPSAEFFENTCDFYFDIDKNGIGEYVSPSISEVLGLSQEELVGANYFDFIPEDKREKDRETFNYFLEREQPYRVVHDCIRSANGKRLSYELYFTTRFDDTGRFVGYRVLGWREDDKVDKKLDG